MATDRHAEPSARKRDAARRLTGLPIRAVARIYGAILAYRLYHPPRRRHHRLPQEFDLSCEAVRVPTDDGLILDVWLVPGASADVAVVGHGIGLTKSASLAQAKLLHDEGFTVAMFDHRNHGSSDADRSARRLSDRFTRDVEACVRFVQRQVEDVGITLVWGFSFSSFPSVYILGRSGCSVDAVICDSGPTMSIRPVFDGFLFTGAMPVPAMLRDGASRNALANTCASVATRMLGTDWPPSAELGRFASAPMLFLVGRDDPIVPAREVADLADRYPRAECRVLDAAHLDGVKADPEEYRRHVREFVSRVRAGRFEPADPCQGMAIGPASESPSGRADA